MKRVLRSIQTFFPSLHDLRFQLKFGLAKVFKTPHEEDFKALQHFKPTADQVYLDVGSNRGEAILSMLISSGENQKIIGFEPNSLIFDKLKSYFKNESNVTVHNHGLGETASQFKLFIPFYRNWMFDGLSSFKYEEAAEWLKTGLWRFDEKKLSIRELECNIGTLDELKIEPYFIKLDVQGFELEVLKGGTRTLTSHRPILLIESIDQKTIVFLKPLGYEFYRYSSGRFREGIGTLNTFCITPEKFESMSLSH